MTVSVAVNPGEAPCPKASVIPFNGQGLASLDGKGGGGTQGDNAPLLENLGPQVLVTGKPGLGLG